MKNLINRPVRVLASASLLMSGLGLLAAGSVSAAHADPSYTATARPYICVGSDTIQDLFNAYSGVEPSVGPEPIGLPYLAPNYYPIMHAAASSTAKNPDSQMMSFDALDPHLPAPTNNTETITPIINGVTFDRPNGSGDGRAALEAAIDGGTFSRSTQPGTPEPTKGEVDCARASSSSGTAQTTVSTASNQMSGMPFASDAIGYAYHCGTAADCTALAQLPSAVFETLYGSGAAGGGSGVISAGTNGWTGSAPLLGCAIQLGSGTQKTFLQQIAKVSGGPVIAVSGSSTVQTNLSSTGGSQCTGLEENNLSSFLVNGPGGSFTNASTADWVEPTSIGNDSAQHNGVAVNRSGQSGEVFFATNGGFSSGDGIAGVQDAWWTTLQAAATPGTTMQIALKPSVGETLSINPGGGDAESVTVASTTAASSGVYTVTLQSPGLLNSHAKGETVEDLSVGPALAASLTGATWSADDAYEGTQFGGWLFVFVNSAEINGSAFTDNQGLADMFYSPLATGGTAVICQSPFTTEAATFGFDTHLPDNGISGEQNGTCGDVEFSGATS